MAPKIFLNWSAIMINKNIMLIVWLRGMAITAVMLASAANSWAWEWGTTQHVWTTGDWIDSCPAVGSNGTIYIGSWDEKFYAFNPDGTTQHVWYVTGGWVWSSPAIGPDGTIYVGSGDYSLYAFNPDGTTQHVWYTGSYHWSTPAIGPDSTIYAGVYGPGYLYLFNPNGTTQDAWYTWGYIFSSPAIGSDETIYVGADDHNLYAFNPDGTTQHVWTLGSYIWSSPAIGSDGTIYVGSDDYNLYAFNPDGTTQHVWTTLSDVLSSPAIGSDDTIYVGSDDSNFYAFNPDGTTQHVWITGGYIESSPAIGSDGTIYVGSSDSNFYAFNPDGTTNRVWTTGGGVYSSPTIGSDGTIYVGSGDSNFYAFNGTGGGLATNTPWPKFHRDLKNTGLDTSTPIVPQVPTKVAASDGTYTNKISVTWNSASHAIGYELYRSTNSDSGTATFLTAIPSGTTYADTTVDQTFLYYYWVKATNTVGASAFSESDSGWRALSAPTGVSATDGTYIDKVHVSWTESIGATGYEVWRNTNDNAESGLRIAEMSGPTNTNYDDATVTREVLYYYWVKATNGLGTSGFSDPWDTGIASITQHVWSVDSGIVSCPAIGSNGTIYVGSYYGSFYAFNPDGTTQHIWNIGDRVWSSPAIGSDGTIYVGSANYNVYAFNPNGTTQHVWTTGGVVDSSPAIGSDGTIYVGSDDGYLYAFNPDGTTQHIWSAGGVGWNVDSSPAIGSDGTIYVGSLDGSLYGFNPDGTTQHVWTTGDWTFSSPAIGSNGTIYFGSDDHNLYAFNPDGTTQHVWTTGSYVASSPAIGTDGTIYVGSCDSNFYAFNPDGTTQHVWRVSGRVDFASPAIGSDGTIYVGAEGNNFYAFNPDGTTQRVWTGGNMDSSPTIGTNGTIYVGGGDGVYYLYAFNGTGGSLATNSPWPKFRQDVRNTGRMSWPGVSMSSAMPDPTKDSPIPVSVVFTEDVTGFTNTDITAGNATVANFVMVSPSNYTFNLVPSNQGLVTADIAAGVCVDSLDNGNMAAQFSRVYDTIEPTVTMSSTATDPTRVSPILVTAIFTENVTGFTNTDITAGNGTVANFATVSLSNYTFNLVPSSQGLVTADIAAGVYQDSAGNSNTAAAQFSRTYDSVQPNVSISSAALDPTTNSPIPVTVVFTENVTGFTNTDVTVENGTVANFVTVSPSNYTFNLVPSSQGLITVNIVAGVCQDSAGNSNTAAAQFSRTYDSVQPSVSMSSTASDPTTDSPIPVTVVFTEDVSGFTNTDITAGNGTVANFATVSLSNYTFNLVPSGQGLITADIAAGVCQDAVAYSNTAAAQFTRTYDSVQPGVSMSSTAPDPTKDSPIPVTVIFSENVSEFTNTDITAGNGTVANFVTINSSNYTFNLIPAGQGLVTADIAAGVCQDSAGNSSTTAAQFSRVYDSVEPSVSMSSTAPDPTRDSSIPVTVIFTENVTGFTNTDITAGNGMVSNFTTVSPSNYTFNLVPSGQGLVTADIAAGLCEDSVGNSNSAADQFSRTYDTVQPSVSMSSTAEDPTTVFPITVTVTFSESVTDFSIGDIKAWNGTAGDFVTISASEYTFELTPSSQGTFTADIDADVAHDAAGNGNTAAAQFTRDYGISTPSNVSASDGTYTDKVRVSWTAVSGATEYEIWRSTIYDSGSAAKVADVADTDYDDTMAEIGIAHYYWLKAKNSLGTSAFSSSDSGWRRSAASTDNADSDMDGDGLIDLTLYQEASGYWYILLSASGEVSFQQFGALGYSPVPADYDGDGKTDKAVYHEDSGYWFVLLSATYSLAYQKFGETGYAPVPEDFDGDGKTDLAVYHEDTGYWFAILSSSSSFSYQKFGESGYTPVSRDFDADGKSDIAVYHETSGYWYMLLSASETLSYHKLGGTGYEPVPADYDDDGKADLAVYQESSGYWYILSSISGTLSYEKLGGSGYEPVPGDYDGDSKADLAVYDEASGYWYILLSETGTISYMQFGGPGYVPVGVFR